MKTYFISGHRDITQDEFEQYYIPVLRQISLKENKFVVGDCPGADSLAIDYLKENNVLDVIVYHIGETPMHNRGFKTIGGFINDFYRDYTMTLSSDEDICWYRKLRSGTRLNVERREWKNIRISNGLPISHSDRLMIEANLFL